MILISFVHSASLSLAGSKTTIVRYKGRDNPMFEKVPQTGHTSFTMMLTSFLDSSSFSLVRCKTNSLHYESLNNSIFQKVSGTAKIAGFMRNWILAVHSARLRPVSPKTSFLRHE